LKIMIADARGKLPSSGGRLCLVCIHVLEGLSTSVTPVAVLLAGSRAANVCPPQSRQLSLTEVV
jgi:hypothetical protein